MEWLALALEDRFNGMLGEAALAVSELSEQRPLAGAISFIQVSMCMPNACELQKPYGSHHNGTGCCFSHHNAGHAEYVDKLKG